MLSYKPHWNRRSTSTGYEVVFCPDHPRAWKTGYVYVHTIVAETKLGRLLDRREVVHHVDGNKKNNHPDNIEVTTQSKHAKRHARSTNMVDLVCASCSLDFKRRKGNDPDGKGYQNSYCSRECWNNRKENESLQQA